MTLRSVCVFCGASPGASPVYQEAAVALGRHLAERGLTLVYGGGAVGLMGTVADAAMAAGGEVIGIIPQSLQEAEIGHKGLTRLEVVDGMHARKARMAELAGAFIALPGGLGTLEELFEVWTWGQLGYHAKPLGLLEVNGFYDPLLTFLDHLVDERFVRAEHRGMLQRGASPEALLDALAAWTPSVAPKWVDRTRSDPLLSQDGGSRLSGSSGRPFWRISKYSCTRSASEEPASAIFWPLPTICPSFTSKRLLCA